MVLLLGGPDEAIERDVEAFIHLPELGGIARRELGGRHVLLLRGLDHFQTMFVGARQEEYILAVEPLKPRQRIGRDRLIGMANMRRPVRIRDRGRDVEGVVCRRRRRSCNMRGLIGGGTGPRLDFRDAFLGTCLTSGFHALANRRR